MKLATLLFLLAILFVAYAQDDAPADDAAAEEEDVEYGSATALEDDDISSTDKLMELLRDGDEENLKTIYAIGLYDGKTKDKRQVAWSDAMREGLECFKFEDVPKTDHEEKKDDAAADEPAARRALQDDDAAAGDDAADEEEKPAYTADECKELFEVTKDWKKDTIKYGAVDITSDDHKDTKKELIEPYFTGPTDRAVPSLFVLKGTGAFLMTGPTSIKALADVLPDLHEDE